MPHNETDYEDGFYFLTNDNEPEPVLVHVYMSSDTCCKVIGFNTHDGGGLLPIWDLTEDSELTKVLIVQD